MRLRPEPHPITSTDRPGLPVFLAVTLKYIGRPRYEANYYNCLSTVWRNNESCVYTQHTLTLKLHDLDSAYAALLQFVYVILPERCYYICTVVEHSYANLLLVILIL